MANPETAVQNKIMLALSGLATLFRNNIGSYELPGGGRLRYGVCNPGGSDLIGWKSIVIGPQHVGTRVAVFVAVEVKSARGTTTPAQDHFIQVVHDAGGLAGVARTPEDALDIIAL